MADGLTGAMALSASGLIKGQGLSINSDLTNTLNDYNNNRLIVAVRTALQSGEQSQVEPLRLLPDFITGNLPIDIPVSPTTLSQSSFSNSNLANRILGQATKLLSSVPLFLEVLQQSLSFVSKNVEFKKTVNATATTNFDDLGFQYSNYTDVITGGVSNQFKTEHMPALAAELKNLGTLFNPKELSKLDDPGILIKNLIQQGLGNVGNLEAQVSATDIDLNTADEYDRVTLMAIISSINGPDLDEIIKTTGFQPYRLEEITDLGKVFEIQNIFSPDALQAIDNGSLEDLSRKLSNIGGSFNNFEEVGNFYSSLNLKSYPRLDQLKTLMPSDLLGDLNNDIGIGTGENNSVTVNDMLGSVSGEAYIDRFKEINETLDYLVDNDIDVYNLVTSLESASYSDLYNLVNNVISKPSLQEIFNRANSHYIDANDKLRLETTNLELAGIDPENMVPNKDSVLNFVNQLQDITKSSNETGVTSLLNNLKTDDIYGDAMEASLAEAHNLNNFLAVGIDPRTRLG